MTLDELIRHAGEGDFKAALSEDLMNEVASELGISRVELCDHIARRVGEAFLSGEITWHLGDAAINKLFAFGVTKTGDGMSSMVWDVYIAFDQAEFRHEGDPVEFDNTSRTRTLLLDAFESQDRSKS